MGNFEKASVDYNLQNLARRRVRRIRLGTFGGLLSSKAHPARVAHALTQAHRDKRIILRGHLADRDTIIVITARLDARRTRLDR
jgi:hypothetical protein